MIKDNVLGQDQYGQRAVADQRENPIDEEYTKEKKDFLAVVFDPKMLQSVCDKIDSQVNRKAEDYIGYWLDELKSDTSLMRRVIETYKDSNFLAGFILSKAIRLVEADEEYFQALYDELSSSKGFRSFDGGYVPYIANRLMDDRDPYADFKLAALKNWHARYAVLARISDQTFLRSVAERFIRKGDLGFDNDGATAVYRMNDQEFLADIAQDDDTDLFIRESAIRRLENRNLLNAFADLPDREADQLYKEVNGKYLYDSLEKQHKPFTLGILRKEARRRLVELDESSESEGVVDSNDEDSYHDEDYD